MFGSVVLEVVIGLVFVYLTLSLLTTAVNEFVARIFALRSGTLIDGVKNIINKPDEFYNHPLIKALSPGGFSFSIGKGKGKPSYIDPKIFAAAALDTLFPRIDENGEVREKAAYLKFIHTEIRKLPDEYKNPLLLALADAEDEIETIRKQLEDSFNEVMARVSGWYRRKAQLISFIVGAFVVLLANADSIAITNALLRDKTLRDAIVAGADQMVQEEDAGYTTSINELQDQLLETQLLGWITAVEDTSPDEAGTQHDSRAMPSNDDGWGWLLKVFGWLITASAISLGAPFWFDVLSRVMSVRATGKLPQGENSQ